MDELSLSQRHNRYGRAVALASAGLLALVAGGTPGNSAAAGRADKNTEAAKANETGQVSNREIIHNTDHKLMTLAQEIADLKKQKRVNVWADHITAEDGFGVMQYSISRERTGSDGYIVYDQFVVDVKDGYNLPYRGTIVIGAKQPKFDFKANNPVLEDFFRGSPASEEYVITQSDNRRYNQPHHLSVTVEAGKVFSLAIVDSQRQAITPRAVEKMATTFVHTASTLVNSAKLEA